jgi:hypothetical protein
MTQEKQIMPSTRPGAFGSAAIVAAALVTATGSYAQDAGGLFGSSLLGKQARLFRPEARHHPGCRERLS